MVPNDTPEIYKSCSFGVELAIFFTEPGFTVDSYTKFVLRTLRCDTAESILFVTLSMATARGFLSHVYLEC